MPGPHLPFLKFPPVVPEVLSLKSIHKQFGNLHANHDISLSLRRGEVLALLGENGAGKTLLFSVRVISVLGIRFILSQGGGSSTMALI